MSYLYGFHTKPARQDLADKLSKSEFTESDLAKPIYTPENYIQGITAGPRMAANVATGIDIPISTALSVIPRAIDAQFGTETNDWWHKNVTETLINVSDEYLTPDPKTTHIALQVAEQLGVTIGKFAATGGNPYLFGTVTGSERTVREVEKGKPVNTALKIGGIEGFSNLIGVFAPPGIASSVFKVPTRVQGAVTGAAINAGIGIPARVMTGNTLEEAGYKEEAKNFAWNDPLGVLMDLVPGAVFGAAGVRIRPSDIDALLTANDARAIENPQGIRATNPAANNTLVDNMNAAVRALANDEPVNSSLSGKTLYESQNRKQPKDAEPLQDINAEPAKQEINTPLTMEELNQNDFVYEPIPSVVDEQIKATIDDLYSEEHIKAVDSFIRDNPDLINGIIEKNYKTALTDIAKQAGWDTQGGQLLRDEQGNVAGRTPWLPQQEWFGRFVKEGLGNKKDIEKAVTRFNEGKALGPKQVQIIDWLKNEVDGNNVDQYGNTLNASNRIEDLRTTILDKMQSQEEQRAKQAEDRKANLSGENVYDDVLRQLQETGVYEIDKDESFAKLMQYFSVTQAKKLKMTPDEYYQEYGAKFVNQKALDRQTEAFGQPLPEVKNYLPEGQTHIDIDGVQKSALNSTGKPIHPTVEGVQNFYKWFGDSKVVDEHGRPLELYHGTQANKQFESFNTDMNDLGTHAGTKNTANSFSNTLSNGRILPIYLNIKNPLRLVDKGGFHLIDIGEELLSKNIIRKDKYEELINRISIAEDNPNIAKLDLENEKVLIELKNNIKNAGYDGVVYLNRREGMSKDTLIKVGKIPYKDEKLLTDEQYKQIAHDAVDSYIAFDPEQIKSATGNTGKFDPNNPNILHQFAGKQAETADLFSREMAIQRLSSGEDAEKIRQETGWFKGIDDQWRFEIDDSKATVRTGAESSSNTREFIDWSHEAAIRDNGVPLSQVLDHPALYAAYPRLQSLRVIVDKNISSRGLIDQNGIRVRDPYSYKGGYDELKSVLLHEIQHGIQSIEGFATGGSPSRMVLADFSDSYKNQIEYLRVKAEQALSAGDKSLYDRLQAQRAQLYSPAQHEAYRRLYGEVESRNTQARAGLTAEERKILPPEITQDIKNSDVVVVFNGKEMLNAPMPENAKPKLAMKQASKGAYYPDSRTIALFKSADASTFLHESGHYFLDLYTDFIKSGMSDSTIDADMGHLLKWFGVKDFQTWARMSVDEQRPYHEQFAKGFETYLSEGTAPTPELLSLFKSFAKWLKQVYGDVQKALGAELNDEVRGVMARIIADEQPKVNIDDTPEVIAARQLIPDIDESRMFEIIDDEGNVIDSGSATELMARADAEYEFSKQADIATQAAITCRLKFGDV